MSWQQGPRVTNLERLNALSTRLMRLLLYKRLEEYEQKGVKHGLCKELKNSVKLPFTCAPKKYSKRDLIRVHEDPESTF